MVKRPWKKTLVGAFIGILVVGIVGVAWYFRSELVQVWRSASGERSPAQEDHAEDGYGEGEERSGADLEMTTEEIAAARCEHDMPTYQCEECRYEVGVVKIAPSLLKDSSGKKGIMVTIPVSKSEVNVSLNVTGEVRRNENTTVHVSPRISGIIRSVKMDLGAQIKKGDVLFEIDSVELGQAISEYRKSQTLTELSRRNFERENALYERKISSEEDMLEAQMTYEKHQTEFKAAEQKLHVFGLTDKEIAAVEHGAVGRLSIRAPLDGTIIGKHAAMGELVDPGSEVMLLADLRTVWIWADIYEHDFGTLIERKKKGAIPVHITVHSFPKRVFKGEVDYIGATMEEKTRTVKVRATVKNEDRLLRPGMFCEIRIVLSSDEKVVAIPKSAHLSDEGRDFVFKHLKEDYYVRRPVKAGRKFDGKVEILDGLSPGEIIVADGAFLLKSDVLRSKMGAGCAD